MSDSKIYHLTEYDVQHGIKTLAKRFEEIFSFEKWQSVIFKMDIPPKYNNITITSILIDDDVKGFVCHSCTPINDKQFITLENLAENIIIEYDKLNGEYRAKQSEHITEFYENNIKHGNFDDAIWNLYADMYCAFYGCMPAKPITSN